MKAVYGDEARIIFIEPPSVEELESRLLKRATDSTEVIQERVKNARQELTRKDDFDFNVVNDNFDDAYKHLNSIVSDIIQGS